MSSPFIGEIRMFGGNFAPAGWAFCDGSILPIAQNDALFTLIGTTYGGDGQTTFALPDLRSRIPIHQGPGFTLAQQGGAETVTLTVTQIPAHSHVPQAVIPSGSQAGPGNAAWAQSALNQFSTNAPTTAMAPQALNPSGSSQPHDNMMPFQAINFILSLFGIFPTQV
ncbi:MAG TPA: tail fiber protein [Candidatus Angelobacter sp.]